MQLGRSSSNSFDFSRDRRYYTRHRGVMRYRPIRPMIRRQYHGRSWRIRLRPGYINPSLPAAAAIGITRAQWQRGLARQRRDRLPPEINRHIGSFLS